MPGGFDVSELIPGLLKCLQIQPLVRLTIWILVLLLPVTSCLEGGPQPIPFRGSPHHRGSGLDTRIVYAK